jgi:hypothetical protein
VSFRCAQLPAHHREEYARDTGSIHKTDEQEDFEKYAAGSANRRHKFLWVFRRNMQFGPDRAHMLGALSGREVYGGTTLPHPIREASL